MINAQGKPVYAVPAGSQDEVSRIAIIVGLATIVCMTFSIRIVFSSYKIPLPYPSPLNNLATQIIHAGSQKT
jgi:hypothetical protein